MGACMHACVVKRERRREVVGALCVCFSKRDRSNICYMLVNEYVVKKSDKHLQGK